MVVRLCRVCGAESLYRCPSCDVRYCSAPCFRRHSTSCLSAFLQNEDRAARAEMDSQRELEREENTELFRRQTEALMREYEAACDFGRQSAVYEIETLKRLAETNQLSISDLPAELVQRFERELREGKLDRFIQPWTPFWKPTESILQRPAHTPSGPPRIVVLETSDDTESKATGEPREQGDFDNENDGKPAPTEVPPAWTDWRENPSFANAEELHSRTNWLVRLDVSSVLFAYCYCMRVFNGDWHADPEGFVLLAETLSPILAGARTLPEQFCVSAQAMLRSSLELLARSTHPLGPPHAREQRSRVLVTAMHDTVQVLSLTQFLTSALSDLRAVVLTVSQGADSARHRQKNKTSSKGPSPMQALAKKLEFFIAWTATLPGPKWLEWATEMMSAADLIDREMGIRRQGSGDEDSTGIPALLHLADKNASSASVAGAAPQNIDIVSSATGDLSARMSGLIIEM